MTAAAPWWRSDGDTLASHEDPLQAHVDARSRSGSKRSGAKVTDSGSDRSAANGNRGHDRHAQDPIGDPTGDRADGSGAAGATSQAREQTATHGHGNDCDVCPICRGIAHVRTTHPEVADHLVDAARHLTLALREIADTVAERTRPDTSGASTAGSASERGRGSFQSIPLDDESGPAAHPDHSSDHREEPG